MSRTEFLFVFVLVCALVACTPVSASEAPNASPYLLPWPADLGKKIFVTQDQNGGNHVGSSAYAFDFDFVGGEDVLASRAGIVSDVHEGESVCGGKDKSEYSNYVVINHGDGQYSYYGHLMPDVAVNVSQTVLQGQLLGHVGNSGWTYCQTSRGGGTHLHFQVQSSGLGFGQSIPLSFSDVEGGIPKKGNWLTSSNRATTQTQTNQEDESSDQSTDNGSDFPTGSISFTTFTSTEGDSFVILDLQTYLSQEFPESPLAGVLSGYDWSNDGKVVGYSVGAIAYLNFKTSEVIVVEPYPSYELSRSEAYATWGGASSGKAFYFSCRFPNPNSDSLIPTIPAICMTSLDLEWWAAIMDPDDIDITFEDFMDNGGRELVYLSPSFSEGDKVLVFLKAYGNDSGLQDISLYVRFLEGNVFTPLDTGEVQYVRFPKVSPDGTTIAFLGNNKGEYATEIWLINADGTNLRQLMPSRGEDDSKGLFDWSPDSQWIVFGRGTCVVSFLNLSAPACPPFESKSDIWAVNIATGEEIQITDTPDKAEWNPSWIPNN